MFGWILYTTLHIVFKSLNVDPRCLLKIGDNRQCNTDQKPSHLKSYVIKLITSPNNLIRFNFVECKKLECWRHCSSQKKIWSVRFGWYRTSNNSHMRKCFRSLLWGCWNIKNISFYHYEKNSENSVSKRSRSAEVTIMKWPVLKA